MKGLQFHSDHSPEPLYEAGWMLMEGDCPSSGTQRQHYAFLRPYSEDWYDLIACPNWWQATAVAMDLARRTMDCEFIGQLGADYEVVRHG